MGYLQQKLYWWNPLCRLLLDDQDRLSTMDWFHILISNTLVYWTWNHSSHDYRHWQDWHCSCHNRKGERTHCSDKPVCSMLRCRLEIQSVLQTLQTTQYNFRSVTIEQQFRNKKLSYRRETGVRQLRTVYVFLGSLTDRALHWTPHLFYNYIID